MSRARDIANYGDGIDTSSITSGTFADARIAQSNVTQHESAIDALASNPTITLGSNATFPTGHVLQTLVESDNNLTSTSNTTYVTPFDGIDITMNGNNYVLVMAFFTGFKSASSSARAYFRLSQDGTTTFALARDVGYTVTDIRFPVSMAYRVGTLTSGQTYNFNVEFQSVSSSGTVTVNSPYSGAGNSTLIVQEIKA